VSVAMTIPEEMRKKYLERRQRDINALIDAHGHGDFEIFVKVGHQLKGNAATFGYDELAVLGRRMEEAGESGSREEADSCLREFQDWLQKQPK